MRNENPTCLALAFWRKHQNGSNRRGRCPRWLDAEAAATPQRKRLVLRMIRVIFAVLYPSALLLRMAAGSNNAASRTPSIISRVHATSKAQDLQRILLLKRSPKVPSSDPSSSSLFRHNVWNQSLSYPLAHTPSIGPIALLPRK